MGLTLGKLGPMGKGQEGRKRSTWPVREVPGDKGPPERTEPQRQGGDPFKSLSQGLLVVRGSDSCSDAGALVLIPNQE